MATPIYDQSVLPCIVLPFDNTDTLAKRYLGGKASPGQIKGNVNIFCSNNAEMNAVHTFWRIDCNYGLEPFMVDMPVLGDYKMYIVRFYNDFSPTKNSVVWDAPIDMKILGIISYVVSDDGSYVVSDLNMFAVLDLNVGVGDIIDYKGVIDGNAVL